LNGSEHPPVEQSARLSFEPVFEQSGFRRVLGIDPGLTRCGYAVLDSSGARSVSAVSLGVITTSPKMDLPERLALLHSELLSLLKEFNPHDVAVEKVFFQVNVRTAMSVGQASGLALAAASAHGCTVGQYSPNQVKDAVTGWGGANKEQVQKMVQARLGLSAPPQPADAADAAALALCHLAVVPFTLRMSQSGVRKLG
jgi:crossover junction endodeoxyribonuclease RuvC